MVNCLSPQNFYEILQGKFNIIITTFHPILKFTGEFSFLSILECFIFLAIIIGSIILVLIAYRLVKKLTDVIADYQKRDPCKESKLKRISKMMFFYLISTLPIYLAFFLTKYIYISNEHNLTK